jgi:nitrite reductase/ring-hydroxylating ferredoxin subunit
MGDKGKAMTEYAIADVDEISSGDRLVVQLQGKEIGVFNVNDEYYAYPNWCAHQGGPTCEGPITGTHIAEYDRFSLTLDLEWTKNGEIINCPWHGWEYDIKTGECLSNRNIKLPSYPVTVRDGKILVEI